MAKLLAYPLTLIFFVLFGLTLLIFHPVQWFSFNVLGYRAHKTSVIWLQFWLMRCTNILGTTYSFSNSYEIEENVPLIIVANHQSMYDIPPILWYFRKHHPKFISKKELGKGIPSVSYNLRHGGSVLIDRRNPMQSIRAIEDFAIRVNKNCWAAVIFPEGTRSRDGHPKPFKEKGLLSLMKHIPNGLVVPLTINNSWKMVQYGKFPLGIGSKISFKVHQPIAVNASNPSEIIKLVEEKITSSIIHDQ